MSGPAFPRGVKKSISDYFLFADRAPGIVGILCNALHRL
jgi:hypothetical protein